MSTQTILIVDDEPDMLWALKLLLQGAGMEVIAVTNAQEAMDAVQQSDQLNMVITDGKLPDVDGIELAKRIHRTCPGRLPVALVSGFYNSAHPDIKSAINSGYICCFISKPFDGKELISEIQSVT